MSSVSSVVPKCDFQKQPEAIDIDLELQTMRDFLQLKSRLHELTFFGSKEHGFVWLDQSQRCSPYL
jgi:hypothetical protein